jgi:hypothetical protein
VDVPLDTAFASSAGDRSTRDTDVGASEHAAADTARKTTANRDFIFVSVIQVVSLFLPHLMKRSSDPNPDSVEEKFEAIQLRGRISSIPLCSSSRLIKPV